MSTLTETVEECKSPALTLRHSYSTSAIEALLSLSSGGLTLQTRASSVSSPSLPAASARAVEKAPLKGTRVMGSPQQVSELTDDVLEEDDDDDDYEEEEELDWESEQQILELVTRLHQLEHSCKDFRLQSQEGSLWRPTVTLRNPETLWEEKEAVPSPLQVVASLHHTGLPPPTKLSPRAVGDTPPHEFKSCADLGPREFESGLDRHPQPDIKMVDTVRMLNDPPTDAKPVTPPMPVHGHKQGPAASTSTAQQFAESESRSRTTGPASGDRTRSHDVGSLSRRLFALFCRAALWICLFGGAVVHLGGPAPCRVPVERLPLPAADTKGRAFGKRKDAARWGVSNTATSAALPQLPAPGLLRRVDLELSQPFGPGSSGLGFLMRIRELYESAAKRQQEQTSAKAALPAPRR
uniref:Uncharacterized protein n=1 Tax=Rhizochromulina marina TaxID=1034831 RepID=A0A7S2S0I9_9STRA